MAENPFCGIRKKAFSYVYMRRENRQEDRLLEAQKSAKQLQAMETRQQIFNAALELLNNKDIEKITVRDIVAAANISIGTFYNYYKTKWDVYYETYVYSDAYFVEEVAPRLEGLSITEQIFLFFDEYARYSSEFTSPSQTKVLFNANNKCFNRDPHSGMQQVLRDIVSRGLKNGVLKPHSNILQMNISPGSGSRDDQKASDAISDYLMISARGLIYNWVTQDGCYDLRAATREYLTLWLKALE